VHVLIVTNHFWPEEFRINDLALGLRERGHAVSVLTGIPNYPAGRFFPSYGFFKKNREIYNGIKIIRAPLIPRGDGSGLRLALNYASYAFFSCLLAPFACREKYDFILVFETSPVTVGLPALLLKKLRKIPILFWVQDLWPETLSATGVVRSEKVLSWVGQLVRFIYRRCDRILIQSKAFAFSVNRLSSCPERIRYFPNTAEELYRPIQLPPDAPEREKVESGFRVMFAGNIGVAQDFGTILDAAERLRDYAEIKWVIIGDGRRRAWVEGEVEKRGLAKTVHLLGRYPVESMPRFFSLADVLLVTLKDEPIFALTIPSKIQSYLACAKPLIACLNGEGARVVEEASAGLTCAAENSEDLAAAVLKMYQLPESTRKELGNNGRKYFLREFERNVLLDRFEEMMKEVLLSSKSRGHNT
jgi:glycosyltransferase involved in cell wall biosynthesis